MNKDEYQAAREALDYTVAEWCDLLGISLGAHKKYVTGERRVSRPIKKLIECRKHNFELQREILMLKYRK